MNLPILNALNFPAAILEPPFFDPAATPAANYGSIGAIIGHEISHSFDDQGSQFDATGRSQLVDARDLAHFKAASAKLVAQYNAYKPLPGSARQRPADAQREHRRRRGPRGLLRCLSRHRRTGRSRTFFISFGQSGGARSRGTDRQQVLSDGHAPDRFRADRCATSTPVRAVRCEAGQRLSLAPADRVRVW